MSSFYVVSLVKSAYNIKAGEIHKLISIYTSREDAERLKKRLCNGLYLMFPFRLMDEDITYLERNFAICDWSDCVETYIKSIEIEECKLMRTE